MNNDSPVYHAFAYNPVTAQYDIWAGIGTTYAIAKRGLRADGFVLWCPHEWLIEGWRNK